MTTKIKIFHWLPRILCLIAILFIGLFALDSFDPRYTFWEQIQAFLIHIIPNLLLLIFLWVAWNHELVGGWIFVILGLGLTPYVYMGNYANNHSAGVSLGVIALITFPLILVGSLFILSHYMKKKKPAN
jgi:hypothetical protein